MPPALRRRLGRGALVPAALNLVGIGAMTAPAITGLPLAVDLLAPPTERTGILALAVTLGAVAATIANPLFGALSDRTRSRLGARHPWIIGGSVFGLASMLWRPFAVVPAAVRDEIPLDLPSHLAHATVPAPPPAVILTPREREVLTALASPDSLAQIAARLHVSVNTIKSQVRSLYRRMAVSSRQEAIAEATRLGLVSLPPSP